MASPPTTPRPGFDAAQRLAAARLWASHRYPYLSTALFAMGVTVVEGLGTVAVDRRWRLYADPEEIARRDVPALGVLLVHHAGHLLRDHAARAGAAGVTEGGRHRWTAACDAEINDDLLQAGHRLEAGEVTPARLGCDDGQLAEAYWAAMGDPPPCADHGSGADGLAREWEQPEGGIAPSEADLLRLRVAHEVLDARRAGDVPGGWQRWAMDVAGSRADWRRVLAGEIRAGVAAVAGLVDYSYRRPSRRAAACPQVVLPALERPVPELAVVVDTSASMDDRLLGRALAEVDGVIRRLGVAGAAVVAVDAAAHQVTRVRTAAGLRRSGVGGGGGTDMGAGLDAAADLRPRPSLVIVLTDGETEWPAHPPPGMRVVVGLVGGPGRAVPAPPPWARTVVVPVAGPDRG